MTDPVDPTVLAALDATASKIGESLDKVAGRVTAEEVFGSPVEFGETVVFPMAVVERAGGFGFGAGAGTDGEEGGGGGGGGGGGSAAGRPVALVEVGPRGVRVTPVLDFTRLGIAALGALLALFGARRRYS